MAKKKVNKVYNYVLIAILVLSVIYIGYNMIKSNVDKGAIFYSLPTPSPSPSVSASKISGFICVDYSGGYDEGGLAVVLDLGSRRVVEECVDNCKDHDILEECYCLTPNSEHINRDIVSCEDLGFDYCWEDNIPNQVGDQCK